MKKNNQVTTYDRLMQNPKFRDLFEKEYREFILQELVLAISAGDDRSVRALAKEIGMHPNAIQNIKSGKTTDIKLTSFVKLIQAFGFSLQLVKGRKHIPITLA